MDYSIDRSGSLEKLFNDLNSQTCSYNTVRFLSFRISLKVRALIAKFKLSYVDYKIVLFQLNQEGVAFGRQFSIPIERARHIIHSIYQSLAPVHFTDISIRDLTDGLVSVFARILNEDRQCPVSDCFDSIEFKLVLFSLLNLDLSMKYMYLYQMMCFPSATITIEQIRVLFQVLAKISICLDNSGDDVTANVDMLIEGLLHKAGNREIDKTVYLEFLNDRPVELEWMHSLHVLLSCANVRHEAQCDVCGTYPIIGLRFRCLSCFDYDLCATCHLLGSFSKDHLPGHDTQQLARQITPLEDMKTLFEIIKRKIRGTRFFSNAKQQNLDLVVSIDPQTNSPYRRKSYNNVPTTLEEVVRSVEMVNENYKKDHTTTHSIDPQTDSPYRRKSYDNVPTTLEEVVRSVEMTDIYDRYVNISSSTIISTTRRHVSRPSNHISGFDHCPSSFHTMANNQHRRVLPSSYTVDCDNTSPHTTAHGTTTKSLVLYQNVQRRFENDQFDFGVRHHHQRMKPATNETWPHHHQRSLHNNFQEEYGFLPESHSTLIAANRCN